METAKILVEALHINKDAPLAASTIWYKPYVASLLEHEAVPSSINNYAKEITRGEMAAMIAKAIEIRLDNYMRDN